MTALAMMRLLRPVMSVLGGQVMLEGEDLLSLSRKEMTAVRGGKIAMIYQDPLSALNPVLSIGSQIVEAVQLHSSMSKTAARVRAIELLGEVGILEPARRFGAYPHEFSGGMRQRALIAMALSGDPAVLIADEPTTALDVTSQARIMDILARLSDLRSMSVLFITHDLGVAAGFCDSVQVMYAGRIVERASVSSFYPRPLHPYSAALLGAVCDLSTRLDGPIAAIAGSPPVAGELEGVCSFHPRCPYAADVCRSARPELLPVADSLVACHFSQERAASDRAEAPG